MYQCSKQSGLNDTSPCSARPEGIMVRITLTAHGRAELLRDRQLTVGQDSGRLYCRVHMGTTLDANGAEIMMVERI